MQVLVNDFFGLINNFFSSFLFYKLPFINFPFILFIMLLGGAFFTLRYGFLNIRLFKHSIDIVRGKYDDPNHPGEISHFQALTSALSATVGLGNIAGVAVAIQLGGPGAVFWLWVVAFLGMSMKLSSCTFGQLYREIDKDGRVLGGPMVYLSKAFKAQFNLPRVGIFLGGFSAVATILGSFGGGNLFQANQTYELLAAQFPIFDGKPFLVGFLLAFFVGVVILGGIKRIATVTSKLVPLMCLFYVGSCMAIIISNLAMVPDLLLLIIEEAFKIESAYAGGFIGVLIQGVQRGIFSSESGVGSAAIAHSAAKTDVPIKEGLVAMLEPVIDTMIVCSMTALAILITGAHLIPGLDGMGAQITARAFATLGDTFPILLTLATAIFAYSTVISYSYYMETAVRYLFGQKWTKLFKVIYISIVILGPALKLGNVIEFSDLMLLSMALPNIVGMMFLSGKVKSLARSYLTSVK